MKLVVQRVSRAKLTVGKELISEIGPGYFVLLGITNGDTEKEADFLAEKLSKLRVMSDNEARSSSLRSGVSGRGKMNKSVTDVGGEMLVVSQFTLYADTTGGNRPSFLAAARPEVAEPLYDYFVKKLESLGIRVKTGEFGADMKIDTSLDGPVTIVVEY